MQDKIIGTKARVNNSVETWNIVIGILSSCWCIFQLYTSIHGAYRPIIQRSIFVGFALSLCFLLYPSSKKRLSMGPSWLDLLLAITGIIACIYAGLSEHRFLTEISSPTGVDIILAIILTIVVLEAARRTIGITLPIFVILGYLYGYLGPHLPGRFCHASIAWRTMFDMTFRTSLGIWGSVTGVGATVIAAFILVGALLFSVGAGDTFRDIAVKIAGKFRGGAALVAVVVSSLFGLLSGSAAANAATTGSFTIPMMKRLGYRPEFAAAVEAAASAGGQIVPPVMGAAVFLMAEITGIPYISICIASIIPAILYYLSLSLGIYFESRRAGLSGVPKDLIPSWNQCLHYTRSLPLLTPIVALMYLIVKGHSLPWSCFWSVVICLSLYLVTDVKRLRKFPATLWKAFNSAARSLTQIAIICVVANIFVGLIAQTGLGVKLSELIVEAAGGIQLIGYILAAIVCLVLGMGMPTVAAYTVAAAVVAPSLIAIGAELLPAHLFLFYTALLSAITPPICAAVFVTAPIANARWLRAAGISCILGIGKFVVPFFFIYSPALLIGFGPIDELPVVLGRGLLCIIFLSSVGIGFFLKPMRWIEKVLVFMSGLFLIVPGQTLNTFAAFIGIFVIVLFQGLPKLIPSFRR